MFPRLQPRDDAPSELDELKRLAGDIEHKFKIGRARDIKPDVVEKIIQLALIEKGVTHNTALAEHLAEISYTAYAILDNVGKPDYYRYLEILLNQMKNLVMF